MLEKLIVLLFKSLMKGLKKNFFQTFFRLFECTVCKFSNQRLFLQTCILHIINLSSRHADPFLNTLLYFQSTYAPNNYYEENYVRKYYAIIIITYITLRKVITSFFFQKSFAGLNIWDQLLVQLVKNNQINLFVQYKRLQSLF